VTRRRTWAALLCWLGAAAPVPSTLVGQVRPDTTATEAPADVTAPNLAPEHDWPEPVSDRERRTYLLADVLEYRPGEGADDFRWDAEGWYGGDYDRVWFKSEGEQNTAFKADYDLDLQLLYGRFVWKYYDFQIGARVETQTFGDENVTRGLAVIGLEGLVPYGYDLESALFIDHDANISARISATRDWLLSQRLILQSRAETNAAVQRVDRFTTGAGLNNLELGLRLRYEIWRKFGPYLGLSFDWSFFDTADLVRQEGGDPSQARVVAGVRVWR
jgi:copper resistance protein B